MNQDQKNDTEIIFTSDLFPEYKLTGFHLKLLKRTYPGVAKFHPYILEAEAWIATHPERKPAPAAFPGFIVKWIGRQLKYDAENKKKSGPEYGDSAARHHVEPQLVGDILRKAMAPPASAGDRAQQTETQPTVSTVGNDKK